jgi:hypothetical protein
MQLEYSTRPGTMINEFVQDAPARADHVPCMSRITLFALLAVTACSTAGASPPAATRRTTMPEFAFLFRSRANLPPDQLARRGALVRDWALALRASGAFRYTSLLDDGGLVMSPDRTVKDLTPQGAVGAVLIVEAADLAAATALARTHPGLEYGTEIEIRPVKPLPVAPPAP